MEQVPYLCIDLEDVEIKINEFARYLDNLGDYSSLIATVYVDSKFQSDIPELIGMLKAKLPRVKIMGGIASSNVINGNIYSYGIAITFLVFKDSQVEVRALPWEDEKSAAVGKEFLSYLRKQYQLVAVYMISSGYNLNITPFFKEISNAPVDVSFFGGVISNNISLEDGCIFTDEKIIPRGIAVAIFTGHSLQVHSCYCNGWQPLGKGFTITEVANGGNTIKTLDGTNIRTQYEKYLGISWDKSFIDEAVVFPMMVERNGAKLYRLPRYLYPDGAVNYGAEFSVGETVKITYGSPVNVIKDARALQVEMKRFQPEVILAISCCARKKLLNQDVRQELVGCRSICPATGVYAHGEYFRDLNGHVYMGNLNMCLMGMREGKPREEKIDELLPRMESEVVLENKENKILSHMMHFVQAVSDELEENNKRLDLLASHDELTGLLNRSELDRKLTKTLRYVEQTGRPMALFLMDLDNFKGINDVYGHLVGDKSLIAVADVLKKMSTDSLIPGRWGGDEFLIILRDIGPEQAKRIAELIRIAVSRIKFEGLDLKLSTSIGVTSHFPGEDEVILFKKADKALYDAKNKCNKNSICVKMVND